MKTQEGDQKKNSALVPVNKNLDFQLANVRKHERGLRCLRRMNVRLNAELKRGCRLMINCCKRSGWSLLLSRVDMWLDVISGLILGLRQHCRGMQSECRIAES